MAFGDVPDRSVQVAGLLGGLGFGIAAAIQTPEDKLFAGLLFGGIGALMGAGVVAIFVPVTCETKRVETV